MSPRIETRYEIKEVLKLVEKECPVCAEPEPCTIEYKDPDKVFVISQDLPCRCSDTVTDQIITIHEFSDDEDEQN